MTHITHMNHMIDTVHVILARRGGPHLYPRLRDDGAL